MLTEYEMAINLHHLQYFVSFLHRDEGFKWTPIFLKSLLFALKLVISVKIKIMSKLFKQQSLQSYYSRCYF